MSVPRSIPWLPGVMLVTASICVFACKPGPGGGVTGESASESVTGSTTNKSTDSSTTANSSSSSSASESSSTGSSSSVGSASSDSSPFPPGCTDGGPDRNARVVGADEIRISTIFTECEDPTEPSDACSWDDYVAVLTIPGLAEGTYDLSEPGGASFVYTLYWDHEQSETGCFCIDKPSGTDIEVLEGMVT
ncbi:MAG TPA: hypothetical protein ENJ18_09935, partial [Nannocystis exedens]|nr:hypothetical protein [Nannocystis exedens]